MSTPNIPNITPSITLTRDQAINLIMSSIAMEELGLAHIINAEGEKIQYALGTLPGISGPPASLAQILEVNNSAKAMLDTIFRQEMMLDSKLKTATTLKPVIGPSGVTGPAGVAGGVISVNGQTGAVLLDSDEIEALPYSEDPSDSPLKSFIQPGVYSSNDDNGNAPLDGPQPVGHPAVWTLYVSRVGNYVQQLYISNPALFYRSSQDAGGNWTPWEASDTAE